jgi:hypothetical protein
MRYIFFSVCHRCFRSCRFYGYLNFLCIGLICDNCILALLSTTLELCVDIYLVRARHQLTTKLNVSYTLLIKGGKFWKVHNL